MHFWLTIVSLLIANSTRADPIVLDCFFCRHSNKERDIIDRLDQHSECLSFELFGNQSQFRRACTKMEPFCMTTVSSLNGFFADMRRDCAERCRPGCEESGYGIFVRRCTRCCQYSLCNHFDGRKFLLNELDVQQMGGGIGSMYGTTQSSEVPLLDKAGETRKETMKMLSSLLIMIIGVNLLLFHTVI